MNCGGEARLISMPATYQPLALGAVASAALTLGVMSFGMADAKRAVARAPAGGKPAMLAERTRIQPFAGVPVFLGSVKLPVNTAPLAITISSPRCAWFKTF